MAEGLTITGLPAAYKDCLGGVLTAVNGVSMDELEQRISPMLSADNDARRHRQFYGTFYVYEILEHYGHRGAAKDIRLTVQTASGAKKSRWMRSILLRCKAWTPFIWSVKLPL